jgi:formate hydrogenlyase subunit 3/multisubunit Na+/H+ antiporter MnhD subunit
MHSSSLYFNFYFIFVSLGAALSIFLFTQSIGKQFIINYMNIFFYLRLMVLLTLLTSLLLHFFTIYFFMVYAYKINAVSLLGQPLFLPASKTSFTFNYFEMSVDFFSLILLLLAYLVGFISIFVLDTRLSVKNIKYLFSFNIFIIIVYLYTTTTNIIMFFVYYELLLLPSFMFVFFMSPSRRAIQASVYFVVWTQIGSLIVLLAVAFLIKITSIFDFNSLRFFRFTSYEAYIIYSLLFIGFGVKVPI